MLNLFQHPPCSKRWRQRRTQRRLGRALSPRCHTTSSWVPVRA